MYSCGAWCGAWFAPGQNHMNQGLSGCDCLRVADELERLVGEVLGEVVALLGQVRLVDVVVVLDQVGIPLVGLAADEAVEAVEAARERPVALRGAHRPLVDRDVVVLADPERVPAVLAQDLGHGTRSPSGCARCGPGSPVAPSAIVANAVLVVVAAGQEARARRRAQRRRVPLRVGQPVRRRAAASSASRSARRTATRPRGRCRRRARSGRSARPPAPCRRGTAPSPASSRGRRA